MYHSTILIPTSMQLSGIFLILSPEKYTKKDRRSLEQRSFFILIRPQTSMMTGRIMGLRLVFL